MFGKTKCNDSEEYEIIDAYKINVGLGKLQRWQRQLCGLKTVIYPPKYIVVVRILNCRA